jgi:hypothetical protein
LICNSLQYDGYYSFHRVSSLISFQRISTHQKNRIVKEGGAETLLQVILIVLIGSVVSNLVCYCIWPQSARFNLQGNMIRTLDSFSTLLTILTDTFLLEEPLHQPSHEKLQRSVDNHQSSFTSLKKNLAEAHSEWFYGGPTGSDRRSSGTAYQDAVDCLNRLAQHLNGLRGGTRLQYELTKACRDRELHQMSQEAPDEHAGKGKTPEESDQDVENDQLLNQAIAMFGELVDDLGAPLKALSVIFSLIDCFYALNTHPFVRRPVPRV